MNTKRSQHNTSDVPVVVASKRPTTPAELLTWAITEKHAAKTIRQVKKLNGVVALAFRSGALSQDQYGEYLKAH